MESFPGGRPHYEWIIQPLIDAGLGREEITALLFRVAFEAVVRSGDITKTLQGIVAARPASVRSAWLETIDRMIASADTWHGE